MLCVRLHNGGQRNPFNFFVRMGGRVNVACFAQLLSLRIVVVIVVVVVVAAVVGAQFRLWSALSGEPKKNVLAVLRFARKLIYNHE